MEQHACWTETVRDIFLSPLQCCLTIESPDEAEDRPLTEGSMAGMPVPLTAEITEATRLLGQPHYQCYGPNQPGLEQEGNHSYKPLTVDSLNIITAAPRPVSVVSVVSVFPLFEESDKEFWDERDGGDTDATDDQDNQTDPFEYDNAPEYRDILGHRVTAASASDLNTLPVKLEEVDLTRDLTMLRRVLELRQKSLRREVIEFVENSPKVEC